MNSIYRQLNGNNILGMLQNFRSTFQGNPREEVQKLLDSGQMSQDQFNRLSQQATELQKLFKI